MARARASGRRTRSQRAAPEPPAAFSTTAAVASLAAVVVAVLAAAAWLGAPPPAPSGPPPFTVTVSSPVDGMVLSADTAHVSLTITVSDANRPRFLAAADAVCVLVDGQTETCRGLFELQGAALGIPVALGASGSHEIRGQVVDVQGRPVGRPGPPVRVTKSGGGGQTYAIEVTDPAPGTLVYEGRDGVDFDVQLQFAQSPPPPGSEIQVDVAGEGPTVLAAEPKMTLHFVDYGTFAADIRVVRWGGAPVPAAPVTSVIFDTRADPADDYGREPAGWQGLAAALPAPPANPRPLRMLYVGDLGKMDGQKGMYLSQFRLLPRDSFHKTLVDLMCQRDDELNLDYKQAVEAAGVRIVRQCLLFPPGVASTAEMLQRLEVLHGLDNWAAVPPELQKMLVELYLLMRGQDVLVVGNSPVVDVAHLVQLARLAQIPARVVDMGGWGPKTPVNPHSVTAFLGSSHFVTQHPALQQYGVPSYVVNPTVDMDKFRPGLPKGGGPIVLGMLGRLSREKNPGVFVSMAALLPADQFKFVVYGDGPHRAALERYAALRGVDIEWVGFVNNDDLPERLHALDLLVCPILQHDTFTLANIEAMAAGVPVAGFAYGGMRGYMQHGVNSLVTDDYTAEGLARLVSSVSRPQLQQLGRSARQFVLQRYDAQRTGENYAAFYRAVAP